MLNEQQIDVARQQAGKLALEAFPQPLGVSDSSGEATTADDLRRRCALDLLPSLLVAGALMELSISIDEH